MKRLTETELAERFRLTTRTLQGWRKNGEGPAYIVVGRHTVLYREEDVLAYEQQREAGGYVPQRCKIAIKRAAQALSLVTTWPSTKPQARATLGDIRDELHNLIGEKA